MDLILYTDTDNGRKIAEANKDSDKYRTDYRKDYARLIHSPSFRRLRGKTQLFPNSEGDFYRNRLTHSMEVAQVAKSIGLKIKGLSQITHQMCYKEQYEKEQIKLA